MGIFRKKSEPETPALDLKVTTKLVYQYKITIDSKYPGFTVTRSADSRSEAEEDRAKALDEIHDLLKSGCNVLWIGDDVFFIDKLLHLGVSDIKEVVKEIEIT